MKSVTELTALYVIAIKPGPFPDGGIPSGHLYAYMMEHGIDLETHSKLVFAFSEPSYCKGEPLIKVSNHYITLTPKGERLRTDTLKILDSAAQKQSAN